MIASHGPKAHLSLRVRLYIAGESPNSVLALANVRAALEPYLNHQVTLEVIDVVADPERGLRDGILVTPMLVKSEPIPEQRVVGNLQDRTLLLKTLGLDHE